MIDDSETGESESDTHATILHPKFNEDSFALATDESPYSQQDEETRLDDEVYESIQQPSQQSKYSNMTDSGNMRDDDASEDVSRRRDFDTQKAVRNLNVEEMKEKLSSIKKIQSSIPNFVSKLIHVQLIVIAHIC